MRRLDSRVPQGFTLVELLVVISIIGVLAAILLVAIFPILSTGPEIQTTNDLRQLTISVNNFKGKYGVFPPSRITLSANYNKIDPTSLAYSQSHSWSAPGLAGPIDHS